jgi:hypothetical protein
MAQYEHLPLKRLEGQLPRRKKGGGRPPERVPKEHGAAIQRELESVVTEQKKQRRIAEFDPSLILKVKTAGPVDEDDWQRVGLNILATDPNKYLVLFADDVELQEFRRRVEAYQKDPPKGQKGPEYSGFVGAIEEVAPRSPNDRLGPALLRDGITDVKNFDDKKLFVLDLELWQPSADLVDRFIYRVARKLEELGGTLINEYRGNAAVLVRVEASGSALKELLDLPEIAFADLPPIANLPPFEFAEVTVDEITSISAPAKGAVAIGIIDSGITSKHPFLEAAVDAAFGVPDKLGDDDEAGHGTPVSGISIYGDLQQRLALKKMEARFRLASARVVNRDGKFDDKELVPSQMEQAIRKLHNDFGCRVINISLSDARRPATTKPSAWAAVLDDLARELDLIIVVSTGNSDFNFLSELGDGIANAYPKYLFENENRILEPASAVNAIVVGAIAHGNGLDDSDDEMVGVRSIAETNQPSPFTRVGPGASRAIKPDFVDYGGTAVFDGPTQAIVAGSQKSSAGILTLHTRYLERLLCCRSGTSFASPLVAYKAALIREAFPDASANLVRALLALSAEYPESAIACLSQIDEADRNLVLGNGLIDIEKALNSDDNRVILYAEDELSVDQFCVYEIPIPDEFQTTDGIRQIRVALAFDPPVRHTRLDYAGISMGFNLVRGATEEIVFDAFRKWEKNEGKAFKIPNKLRCDMLPKQTLRERGTLQRAMFEAKRDISRYGSKYFLVVRCEGGWASDILEKQNFAVAVELRHQAEIQLYSKVRIRIKT